MTHLAAGVQQWHVGWAHAIDAGAALTGMASRNGVGQAFWKLDGVVGGRWQLWE